MPIVIDDVAMAFLIVVQLRIARVAIARLAAGMQIVAAGANILARLQV
jgi:hypothetical protein